MKKIQEFERCIHCFAEKEENRDNCPVCGYENGICDMPVWWLSPGTILKGVYMVGKPLEEKEDELIYLGWDMRAECRVEITEYYPRTLVKRDITVSEQINCIPGQEEAFEKGKQEFFEKAKLFYQCVSRVKSLEMDFFVRNETCYYVRNKLKK